ncbi:MAG TPA: aldo/keto reductase, partial [Stellaceae bacterium]|nr:aldo/keto reductase [Stellaceae bacterium]
TSIVVGGPLNSGILAGRDTWNYRPAPSAIVERVTAIAGICDAHRVPLAAAALQFPLPHPAVAAIIPGPRNAAEFNANLELLRHPIPPAQAVSRHVGSTGVAARWRIPAVASIRRSRTRRPECVSWANRIRTRLGSVCIQPADQDAFMHVFIGLDVSLAKTAICVVDRDGTVQWQSATT